MRGLLTGRFRLMFAVGVLSLGLAACGGSGITGNGLNGDGGGGGNGDGGGGGGHVDSGSSGGGGVDAKPCAAKDNKAQQIPLDMYIMLDQSGSMGRPPNNMTSTSKWDSVTSALKSFVTQKGLGDVSVGIQYFGQQGLSDDCTVGDYATPDVEIAPLTTTQQMKLTNSINSHSPGGDTPTNAALTGAIQHSKMWETAHPDHVTVVVLATDGQPNSTCNNETLNHIETVAKNGATGTPKILTFVIGIGSSLTNLNGIASSGGTGQAIIVDTSMPNVNQQFLDALNMIRGKALGCVYKIPQPGSGQTVDYNKVEVKYTPSSGSAVVIPRVQDKASCPASGDGWYYDNNTSPTTINLCSSTCQTVSADTMGQIDILTGCSVVVQ